MSTVAGMFFVNTSTPGQDIPTASGGSSMADPESNANLSEDDNTSCSNSEMGSDVVITPSPKLSNNNHVYNNVNSLISSSSSSSRKNKRKNFCPRNITEYAGSDEEEQQQQQHDQQPHPHHAHQQHTPYGQRHGQHSHRLSLSNPRRLIHQHHQYEQQPLSMTSPEDDNNDEVDEAEEDDEDEENEEDQDNDTGGELQMDVSEEGDAPLDLSEVQNDSKRFWRRKSTSADYLANLSVSAGFRDNPANLSSLLGNNSSHFSPMDLRLPMQSKSLTPRGISALEDDYSPYHEDRSNDLVISSTSSNSNNSPLNNGNLNPNPQLVNCSSGTSALTDFAESTMKELLGLYGIAENLRQGGKPSSSDIPSFHRLDASSGQQAAKMMLPENMARFLAAMQESVSNSSNSSNPHLSPNHHSHQIPLNFANSSGFNSPAQQQHLHQSPHVSSGSSVLKSQLHLNNNNNNSSNNNSNGNNHNHSESNSHNHSILIPNQHKSGGLGKSRSSDKKILAFLGKTPSGRGLASFPVIREGLLGKGTGPVDYTRYVRRYGNSAECGYQQCRDLNYREHFHCLDCGEGSKIFLKKEEMIRHFKWHKKRDESLQHGFMRYSPMDDCSDRFQSCTHNRKQTHYHCLQDSCEKVYISTSDVQMHANYHRKDSAIIQEGFQRFRAAEDCGADHCGFRHQRTTHFHCRRPTCSYTFKNKADMEKHKSYHVKDEQLNRDGFKKFMKHEACHYSNCRFSRVCNHIHCIRDGCNYVLHSSGQLYSHKRKHERRDSELAYRKFKLAQSVMRGTFGAEIFSGLNESIISNKSEEENSRCSLTDTGDMDPEDTFKKFVQPCKCDVSTDDHFHCRAESCVNALLGNPEVASDHSRNHELEDRISSLAYFTVDPANFDAQDSTIPCVSAKCAYQNREKHYHCLWDSCSEVILATDEPFKRLDHFKGHEASQKLHIPEKEDMDGFFRKKRGRPPKNQIIEVTSGMNEAIFTSFKLPKPIFSGFHPDNDVSDSDLKDPIGFMSYPEGTTCPDSSCAFNTSQSTIHYHCGHPRCHFAVKDVHKLSLHLRDFHSNVDILDGYEYFDRNSDCRDSTCEFNGSANHFHCMRDSYIFSRYSSMATHDMECHESKSNNGSSDEDEKSWNAQVTKSSGPFYLTSGKEKKFDNGNAMDLSSPNGDNMEMKPITDHSLSRILQLPETSETQFGPDLACGRPFCKLKRKCHFHCNLCNQAFSEMEKLRPHVLKHNTLTHKTSSNFDADSDDSDQGESDDHEQATDLKLFGRKIKQQDEHSVPSSPPLDGLSTGVPSSSFTSTSLSNFLGYPPQHSPYLFLQQNPLTSLYAGMMFGGAAPPGFSGPPQHGGGLTPPPVGVGLVPSIPPPQSPSEISSRLSVSPLQMPLSNSSVISTPGSIKRAATCSPCSPPPSPSDGKKQRLQLRILKDEPVPDGYVRFRFNEDCAYIHCGYREHQTHFHCTREDCGYSFCDKTRFVQHTARHERLDTLMGGDFKQYRANVSCARANCAYVPATGATSGQNKASHFHCLKCDFVCTDTNKVVAHRRQHQKLDSIMAAGFEKFTPSQHCHIEGCIHAQKQTHYHCLKCSYAVLGLSQMSAHKYRHAD